MIEVVTAITLCLMGGIHDELIRQGMVAPVTIRESVIAEAKRGAKRTKAKGKKKGNAKDDPEFEDKHPRAGAGRFGRKSDSEKARTREKAYALTPIRMKLLDAEGKPLKLPGMRKWVMEMANRVPLPFGRMRVINGPPPGLPGAYGAVTRDTPDGIPVLYMDFALIKQDNFSPKQVFMHEMAHQFDARRMPESMRAEFRKIMRYDGRPWQNTDPTGNYFANDSVEEPFADAYAAAGAGARDVFDVMTQYSFQPTQKQWNKIRRMFRRMAREGLDQPIPQRFR